ncbi:MAG: FRG domain-containing protein, partial [Mucispirillum sp.]|nr:FRG domain-containing protein [Mucispirillum sp.]
NYPLVPSIERLSQDLNINICTLEEALINKAKNEYPTLFSETNNPLDLLVKLQHYGIPTRLLDITANPLVALYFAIRNNLEKNGELLIIGNQYETYFDNILYHDIAKYMGRSDIFLTNIVTIEDFYIEILNRKKQHTSDIHKYITNNYGEEAIIKMTKDIYFIYPPRLFERLYIQQGYFILLLNNYSLNISIKKNETIKYIKSDICLSPIPKDHKNIIARYIIPAKSKKNLLEELKMLNITESTLFHDDVDTVCKNIVADFKGRYGR